MAQYLPSRVFLVMEALYERLNGLSWPSGNSEGVRVFIGEPLDTEPVEFAAVFTEARAAQSPRTSNRRNEEMTMRVRLQTHAAHRDSLAALQRAGELSATVEESLRDMSTGKPIPLTEVDGLDVDVVLDLMNTTAVTPRVYPLENGWGAQVDIEFPLTAVI